MDVDSNGRFRAVRELLEQADKVNCRELEKDKKTARRFNVFNALGVQRAERAHSQFLACLLDPKGIHSQKDLFLRTFLEDVICEPVEMPNLTKAEVRTEVPISSGRLDILIILPDRQLVALENKIDAGEGDAQLEGYRKWLQDQPPLNSGRPHHLVFLTPDGRSPLSCSSPDIKCISYEYITDWLRNLNLKDGMPDSLRIIIDQYVNLWRGIPMNSEMNVLVRDQKNFETAECISKAVEEVKKDAKEQFLNQIQQDLKSRLETERLDSNWETSRTLEIDKFPGCGLAWKNRKRGPKNRAISLQQFTVLCEVQDAKWTDIIVGICRGTEVREGRQVERDKELSQSLLSDPRFRQSSYCYWPGYVKLKDLVGGRTIGEKDLVFEGHQFSKLVADELWRLFEAYRNELEDLNRNYPY